MVGIFKNLFVHFRTWIKFLIILAIGLGIIFFIVFSVYKPMYAVTIDGEFIGYTADKSKIQNKISDYMKYGNSTSNIAFVDIETLPEYSFCLLKKDYKSNDDEIFNKVINTGITYYKYYAVLVNSEEKCYVSSYQECESIIQGLKDKDSQNKDQIGYIVKYETDLKEFTNTETAIANLYVEKPKVVTQPKTVYRNSGGSIATGANISYSKVDLGISLINPISGRLTSRFGERSNIRSSIHTGLDIAASKGTPIHAVAGGTVAFSGWKGSLGQMIAINHGNGVMTYYCHCSKLYKNVGETVNQGDVISAVGETGNAHGAHLHIEIRVNGVAYDPDKYLY